ncbi:unnamed protein product, partial [Mesorhabditis belari]|uniref:Programmed cell death protein 10 n=1 Tax=Mesorhabditis belari TaxID=2138241 RepID=A0AAF3ETS0_9BILA
MDEEGAYLGHVTYQCIYSGVLERMRKTRANDTTAQAALQKIRVALKACDQASPGFLYDFTKSLLTEGGLEINMQEAFLRLQGNASDEDLKIPIPEVREFRELSDRAIMLRRVLARVPEEMTDRRRFLETIKEIASSIKKLLEATNATLQIVPESAQHAVEKRKREFVHYSKQFSNTLKDYFRDQNALQVSISANRLIFQTQLIIRTVNEKMRKH